MIAASFETAAGRTVTDPAATELQGTSPTLSVLTQNVQAIVDAWEQGDEPVLADFVPSGVPADDRRLTLIELVKVDLEYRWGSRNLPKRLEEYFEEFPELDVDGCPLDLVYEEYHLRRNCGFPVTVEDYVERFPDREPELRRLLSEEGGYAPTSIVTGTGHGRIEEFVAGDQIDDFDLLAVLGQGAFAKVFLARQISMQRLVALKVSANTGTEHQLLAQFDHESIVRVFDQRVDEGRGLRLLYMQYVPGGTLHDVVRELQATPVAERSGRVLLRAVAAALDKRGETLEASSITREVEAMTWPETVCWIGAKLARALEYAHSRGVLHRDVKPANVLVSKEGVPKLADFNIGFSSKQAGVSPAAYFGGSLAYMSPEQLEACSPACDRTPDDLDGRSDLFTLGVVLWELLTGERPFRDGPTPNDWTRAVAEMAGRRQQGVPPEALDDVPEEAPKSLVRTLVRTLSPDREERWSSGTDLARHLDHCRNHRMQEFLDPPEPSWASRARRFPVSLILVAALLPNVLAGIFNFAYNDREIVGRLGPESRDTFLRIQAVVNGILYPLGLGLCLFLAESVRRVVVARERGDPVEPTTWRRMRRRCLDLGHVVAIVCTAEWMLAGFVYPIAMHFARAELSIEDYVHFWASLALCGLIAAAYPFFGVTFVAVRGLYARLAGSDLPADDVHLLERLATRCWFYLAIAVTVPFASMLVLSLIESQFRLALVVLSGGAMVGFGIVYWLFREVQRDVTTLLDALGTDHET